MKPSLIEVFNQKGIFDAAPSFERDFAHYTRIGAWPYINCMAYALGYRGLGFRQFSFWRAHNFLAVQGMSDLLSFTNLLPIEDNDLKKIGRGHYPVALFLAPNKNNRMRFEDYHWYRMDNDGTWSHKCGWVDEEATNLDAENRVILEPREASRRRSDGVNYSRFAGFWAVPKGGATFSLETRQRQPEELMPHLRETLKKSRTKRPVIA